MSEHGHALTIKRHQTPPPYEQLRSDLIDEVQLLTAHQWTDFNLHDPGVTILEQLAYALTDVNFRSNYSVASLLADAYDAIELKQHGMFAPEDAFVCRPVSQRDLQAAILNDVPELAYVQVNYLAEFPGLIDITITSQVKRAHKQSLLEAVTQSYHRHRNLGENLHQIQFIDRADATLQGQISIHRDAIAERVVAAVFFTVQQFLIGTIKPVAYQARDQLIAGSPFDGPRMRHHFIDRDDLLNAEKPRSLSALIEQLMRITGLASVKALSIHEISRKRDTVHHHFLPPACELALYLIPPLQADVLSELEVRQQGSRIELDSHRLRHEFQALVSQFKSHRQMSSMPPAQKVLSEPDPKLTDFSSIQGQFPSNYGINAFGVPNHSDAQRKAQARQLQGYLLLYDHILHDHLQLLASIKQLFSLNIHQKQPYPARLIEDPNAYDLASLYSKPIPKDYLGDQVFGRSMAAKKTECLDLLMVMNGREKSRYAHELFPMFHALDEQQQHHLERQKQALMQVHYWSEHRGGGRNLYRASANNIAALEKRIRLLLDAPLQSQSLGPKTVDELKAIKITDQKALKKVKAQLSSLVFRAIPSPLVDSIEEESLPVTPVTVKKEAATEDEAEKTADEVEKEAEKKAEEENEEAEIALIVYLHQPAQKLSKIWSSWMLSGADLNRYRIVQLLDKKTVELVVNLAPQGTVDQWHYLGSFRDVEASQRFANQIRRVALADANRRNGIHLIEHLPLLPTSLLDQPLATRQAFIKQQPFYCNQLTWVLPSDTARNRRSHFPSFVSKQIWQECPAHLYSHIVFLDAVAMQKFETLFADWQTQYRQQGTTLDAAANALRDFLLPHLPVDMSQGV